MELVIKHDANQLFCSSIMFFLCSPTFQSFTLYTMKEVKVTNVSLFLVLILVCPNAL